MNEEEMKTNMVITLLKEGKYDEVMDILTEFAKPPAVFIIELQKQLRIAAERNIKNAEEFAILIDFVCINPWEEPLIVPFTFVHDMWDFEKNLEIHRKKRKFYLNK